jgi:hypothetical protein
MDMQAGFASTHGKLGTSLLLLPACGRSKVVRRLDDLRLSQCLSESQVEKFNTTSISLEISAASHLLLSSITGSQVVCIKLQRCGSVPSARAKGRLLLVPDTVPSGFAEATR